MTVSTILDRVRHRRIALNYSQEYLAAKLKISQNTYSKTELNNSKLTVERLLEICAILDVDVKDVIAP